MRIKKKIINVFAIALCCKMLMLPINPAHAISWPTISVPAVSAFINTVTTGLTQIGVSKAQIENYTNTIYAIGDQVSTVAKFATDIRNSIESIIASIEQIVKALTRAAYDIDTLMNQANEAITEAEEAKNDIADNAVDTVNNQAENDELTPDVLETFMEETKAQDEQLNAQLEEAIKKVEELGKFCEETLEALRKALDSNEIDEAERIQLQKEIEELQKRYSELEKSSKEMLNQMKQEYNENSQKIYDAYEEYEKAIEDYNNGKISKEELAEKGNQLKEVVNNAQESTDYNSELKEFSQKIEELVADMQDLEEKIKDIIANNKDYPDDAMLNIKEGNQKFAFNFHQENNNINLKSCFAKKGDCGLYTLKGGDKSFLLSKELTAKGIITIKDSNGQCQKLTFKDIEDNRLDWFTAKLQDCLVRANTEKTYFWPDAASEEELEQHNIFDGATEPNFHRNEKNTYAKKGVYRHIAEEYGEANITNSNENRAWVASWMGYYKPGTLDSLRQNLKNIGTERNGRAMHSKIEINFLQMYSRIRRLEAINMAKKVVNIYRPLRNLYIDGRDGNYISSNDSKTGIIKEEMCSDCGKKDITVISNVFPYLCGYTGKHEGAKAFSVPYKDKNNKTALVEAEKNVMECIKAYVGPATKGPEDRETPNPDSVKRDWRINETRAMTDSLFHSFTLSTINLYNSSKEGAHLDSTEKINIASLQKQVKDEAKDLRNDMAIGASINKYGSHILLTIIDADAQALESEILEDMLNVTMDYFPE